MSLNLKTPLLAVLLMGVFVVVTGSTTLADFGVGLLVGLALAGTVGRQTAGPRWTLPVLAGLPRLAFGTARELLRGTWAMLLVLLGARTWRNLGYVRVPIGERTPRGVAVSAFVTTASPGSILVDAGEEPEHREPGEAACMLFHVIDASDPEGVREEIDELYERYQRPSLP